MSIDSALVMFRDALPSRAQLEAKLGELGYDVDLRKFEIAGERPGWVDLRVDGKKTGFDYGLFPLTRKAFGPFPKKALAFGDVALSFGARGRLSIIAVSAVQHALSVLADAHGLIEAELVSPAEMQRGSVESIAYFSTAEQVQADRPPAADSFGARWREVRGMLPGLAMLLIAAVLFILGFPRLLAWAFR